MIRSWCSFVEYTRVGRTNLLSQADAEGDLDWAVAVDPTVVRAHQHAAGARKKAPVEEPDHHAPGRSRGGLTTKIHLAVDSRCCPLAFANNPGQAGDAPAFPDVMTGIRVPRPVSRPRTTPAAVLADKAHSSRAIRTYLRHRGIRAVIPQPVDQAVNRKRLGSCGGRLRRSRTRPTDSGTRSSGASNNGRACSTRYDKTATIYLAALALAGISVWSAK
ncbi:IS5 family transposase [[Kitasatospora] papulosa]